MVGLPCLAEVLLTVAGNTVNHLLRRLPVINQFQVTLVGKEGPMRWLWVLFWCFGVVTAQAGAWPRDQGAVFISISADQTRKQIYAEYGLRGDWTLGAEVSMPRGRRLPDVTQFVHHPVWRGSGGAILSAGIAVDLRETTAAAMDSKLKGVAETAVRAGLFWGKGFDTRFGSGWATIEAQVERLVTTDWLEDGLAYKLDLGVGLKPSAQWMLIGQAQLWRRGASQSLRIETSAALKLGPTHVVVSPSVGVVGVKERRVKLALWVAF
jgi:hypothetical protein